MSTTDRLLSSVDAALRTLSGSLHAGRPTPGHALPEAELTEQERRLSGALMRVNHVGEVCAQALYQAQALIADNPQMRQRLLDASREESDHLAWTQQRLRELGDRPSWLNPLWYVGAFGIGLLAGRLGDGTSLGFVVETERQVEEHLAGHLDRLPDPDRRSRAIVDAMKQDERRHAEWAEAAGAEPLPAPLTGLMRLAARVMTTAAHRL